MILDQLCKDNVICCDDNCKRCANLIYQKYIEQKAEIERLKKQLVLAEECIDEIEDAAYRAGSNDRIDEAIEEYNNLVKEMVGDNNV